MPFHRGGGEAQGVPLWHFILAPMKSGGVPDIEMGIEKISLRHAFWHH